MAEFWPEERVEPSSAKFVKPASGDAAPAGAQSDADEPPTVLSSFKPPSLPGDAPALVASELAGEMLAHFRLDDYIGVGGMGAVFRATDIRLDRPVALKILPPEQAKDPDIVARFQHEARAAARLDHENIARVYFVGQDRGLDFIAFEYVEGVNVRDLIQQVGPLPPHEAVNYALQISGALVHAVSRSVVHRDIKPSNIIITPTGRAKLVDMGLARNFERRRDGGITQSGVTLGTFDYISPEQARDPRSADVRSDIYSLGCTLFHMLTGRPPFPDGTVLQKLLRHQEDAPPDPRQFNRHVSGELAELVMRMTAKDPARRFQGPQDLLAELLDIASNMGLRSSSPEGLIWVAEPARPALTRAAVGVWFGAAAVLVIAGWLLYGRPAGPNTPDVRRTNAQVADAPIPTVGDATGATAAGASAAAARSDAPAGDSEPIVAEAPVIRERPVESPAVPLDVDVIAVGPRDDLRSAIERAASGAVIELSGEHRPQVLHRVDDTAGIRVEDKRLVVRAAPGTQPRIVLSLDEQLVKVSDWNLFSLVRSHVEFEGIHFEIVADSDVLPAMAILSLESSQVTARRCSFYQVPGAVGWPGRPSEPVVWVAQLENGRGLNGQLSASRFSAHECLFFGGDGAFVIHEPAKLDLSECTLIPYRAAVRVRSGGFPQAAELRLTNVTWFGGGTPIFDLEFARAAVHCRDVVFSHSAAPGVLARVDDSSRLDWKGRRNLYHGFQHFLVTRSGAAVASRLGEWTQEVDETESVETTNSPWIITLDEAERRSVVEAANAFRLTPDDADLNWQPIGARFVLPWGALYPTSSLDPIPLVRRSVEAATASNSDSPSRASAAESSDSNAQTARSGNTAESGGARLDLKKIMSTPMGEGATAAAITPGAAENKDAANPPARSDTLVVNPQNASAFQSLFAACSRADDGAVIEIRHNGELREPPIELGDRHLAIRAAPGFRPIIQLVATPLELRGREPRLFDIRRGSLTLRDLDIQITADPAVSAETWSVVTARRADVTVERCTISWETPTGLSSTAVRVLAADNDDPMAVPMPLEANPARPQVQIRNSLCVGATSVVRLQSAQRARVNVENCAIEVAEYVVSLVGGAERAMPGSLVEFELRHSTIRSDRGLVRSDASEPRGTLPRLEIDALDNIFVARAAAPWLEFTSPRPASELLGLLRWKGMNNYYDGVDVFWHIESMLSGETDQFDWDKWSRFPDRSEVKDERGRVEFAASATTGPASARTRNHFKLAAAALPGGFASDGGSRGADLSLIPATPAERQTERN